VRTDSEGRASYGGRGAFKFVREKCFVANPEIMELKFGCEFDTPSGRMVYIGESQECTWNLCADDLEQQSEETINFLCELLL
jgi:hypothetical protein